MLNVLIVDTLSQILHSIMHSPYDREGPVHNALFLMSSLLHTLLDLSHLHKSVQRTSALLHLQFPVPHIATLQKYGASFAAVLEGDPER